MLRDCQLASGRARLQTQVKFSTPLLQVCDGGIHDGDQRFSEHILCGQQFRYIVSFSSQDGP